MKVILITGATDGIGLLTAKELAAEGHKLLIHGRSATKLEAAAAEIGGDVEPWEADLSDLAAVRKMAEGIRAQHERLDVLINNAGVLKAPQTRVGGLDLRVVVNTLAPYLLSELLLPIIPKEGRIVNLSSAAQAPVDIAAFKGAGEMADMDAYAQSKLALTVFSRKMAEAHPDGPVIVSVNPASLLASKMVKEGFGIAGNDMSVGSDILKRAALSAEFAGASGQYYDNDAKAFAPPHAAALDEGHAGEIMQAIHDMLEA